jgi:hypothetical protein
LGISPALSLGSKRLANRIAHHMSSPHGKQRYWRTTALRRVIPDRGCDFAALLSRLKPVRWDINLEFCQLQAPRHCRACQKTPAISGMLGNILSGIDSPNSIVVITNANRARKMLVLILAALQTGKITMNRAIDAERTNGRQIPPRASFRG